MKTGTKSRRGDEQKVSGMMVRMGVVLGVVVWCAGVGAAGVVADHRAVEEFTKIPDYWVSQVKSMLVNYPGESHGNGMLSAFRLVEQLDARFAVSIRTSGAPETDTDVHLRIHKPFWGGSSWVGSGGEEDTWTNQAAIDRMNNSFAYARDVLNNPFDVFVFGWCWDMTWHNSPGGGVDPVYDVRWAGSTVGGPDGDMRWGLDAEDTVLTGNSVSLQNHLDAWDYYQRMNPDTLIAYSTGPVDSNGESGYQRHLKQERIREWVANDANRVLFDYGDILTYNGAGEQNTASWDGHVFPYEHPENNGEDDPFGYGSGHASTAGYLKLGKAMWWMLARIAGWDGCAAVYGDVTGDCSVDTTDFAVMAAAWGAGAGEPNWNGLCDLAPEEGDGVVDLGDLAVMVGQWLAGAEE